MRSIIAGAAARAPRRLSTLVLAALRTSDGPVRARQPHPGEEAAGDLALSGPARPRLGPGQERGRRGLSRGRGIPEIDFAYYGSLPTSGR